MSGPQKKQIEIAILASAEATPSTVYGMQDMLASSGRDWQLLMEGTPGKQHILPRIVAKSDKDIVTLNNAIIRPHRVLSDDYFPDAVCVLELFIAPDTPLNEMYAEECRWLKDYRDKGGIIASACSGTMLLAEAGILDNKTITSHWAYCNSMAQRHPSITLLPARNLVVDEAGSLITAGGGSCWMDLGLHLISKFVSSEEAIRVAKIHLIDLHENGQNTYMDTLHKNRQSQDKIISECQVWLANNYEQPSPINYLVNKTGLSNKSLTRRFKTATGMTPIEYVIKLRIEEAKQMLESMAISIEEIAEQVGYMDASFFVKKFKSVVGLTPARYRKKYCSLQKF